MVICGAKATERDAESFPFAKIARLTLVESSSCLIHEMAEKLCKKHLKEYTNKYIGKIKL
jgi:hypothetical protein